MQDLYVFDFLRTVSQQLKDTLEALKPSPLDDMAIVRLQEFQLELRSAQGVYMLIYNDEPKYIGKANNVKDRLSQHLTKLRGRQNIDLKALAYKVLILDKSMSTAANEAILIGMFKEQYNGMWNGAGFGPKDPGRERDTTKPGKFDQQHPIIDNYHIDIRTGANGAIELGNLLSAMKAQLPYVFRYEVPDDLLSGQISITADNTARGLLQTVVSHLGVGWRGAIISYGMVLYKSTKRYPHGIEVDPIHN